MISLLTGKSTFWVTLKMIADRPSVDTELPSRIASHTFGAFRPSLRQVKRAVAKLAAMRMIEFIGATGIRRLTETGRVVVEARMRTLRRGT